MQARQALRQKFYALFLAKDIMSKKAPDGNKYHPAYTELQALSELEFLEVDGKLEADISKTPTYARYYAPGKQLHNSLTIELIVLGQYLGFQFDPRSNYHGKLIISAPESVTTLKNAGVVLDKPIVDTPNASSNPSLFTPASNNMPMNFDLAKLKEVHRVIGEEVTLLEKRKHEIENEIWPKKRRMNNLERIIQGLPIHFEYKENLDFPGVDEQPLLQSFFKLRDLLKTKFAINAACDWDSKNNVIDVIFSHGDRECDSDTEKASMFLTSVGGQFSTNIRSHTSPFEIRLNQKQCDAAITALKLFQDKTPEEIAKIRDRPMTMC